MRKRIGVLTSGGDCPGLNAVLRGVTRASSLLGWEVVGFMEGFEGLLSPPRFKILDRATTAGIMHLGGTILGTTNKGHFVAKIGTGKKASVSRASIQQADETLREKKVHALIVIGGDGSMATALQLYDAGMNVVGVPKTIDNDIEATTMTFGFDSAVTCVADALDRLHTTATAHRRVMVVEVMGRHAGWIALHGGLAGGADIILIPEIPFSHEKVAEYVEQRAADGCLSTLIVVAEGARPKDQRLVYREAQKGEVRLGGIAEIVAKELARRTHKDTRTCVLGHLQRGGRPTPTDRILGTQFGVKAVELVERELFGYMVSYQHGHATEVPIADAVSKLRRVAPDSQLVDFARSVDISFGD